MGGAVEIQPGGKEAVVMAIMTKKAHDRGFKTKTVVEMVRALEACGYEGTGKVDEVFHEGPECLDYSAFEAEDDRWAMMCQPHWHIYLTGEVNPEWNPWTGVAVLPGTESRFRTFGLVWDQSKKDASWEFVNEGCTPEAPCVLHPYDDNGTHGGAPHIHHCTNHRRF